ncbi:MAG: hypothetical protein WCQ90_13050 [Deltaproteobacteria bacterium]
MNTIDEIEVFGIRAKGQAERIRFLKGEPLTRSQAMLAHCYDCTGGYADGARDCEIENCSMYPFMPYAKRKDKAKTVRSEKQKENDRNLSLLRSTDKQNKGLQELM